MTVESIPLAGTHVRRDTSVWRQDLKKKQAGGRPYPNTGESSCHRPVGPYGGRARHSGRGRGASFIDFRCRLHGACQVPVENGHVTVVSSDKSPQYKTPDNRKLHAIHIATRQNPEDEDLEQQLEASS